jgi:3-phenylpropionate/cinnamic acid dioxygenase small subunit
MERYEARDAVTDLLFRYAALLDGGDLEGVAALFEHASYTTVGMGAPLVGAAAVLAAQRQLIRLYDGSPRTHHVITNVVVELDPALLEGWSRSYFSVVFAPPGGGDPRTILTGRYHDRFECADEGWRFAERLIHLDQVGDLGEHLHLDRLPS